MQTESRGTATVNRVFDSYGPYIKGMERKPRAAMVSMQAGQITAYALDSLQARGRLFVAPGTRVSVSRSVYSERPSFTKPSRVFILAHSAEAGWRASSKRTSTFPLHVLF